MSDKTKRFRSRRRHLRQLRQQVAELQEQHAARLEELLATVSDCADLCIKLKQATETTASLRAALAEERNQHRILRDQKYQDKVRADRLEQRLKEVSLAADALKAHLVDKERVIADLREQVQFGVLFEGILGTKQPQIDASMWKKMMQLAHPDRHPDSRQKTATEVMAWLNRVRPKK